MKTLTALPVVDVVQPGWFEYLKKEIEPKEIQDCFFPCIAQAYITARKRLPSGTIAKIDKLEQALQSEEELGPQMAAIRIGDIAVSKRFHPIINDSKAWLSPYHLELAKQLIGEGFVVEILDESNNPVTTLGKTE